MNAVAKMRARSCERKRSRKVAQQQCCEHDHEESISEINIASRPYCTVYIVFFALIMDLLAFTMILPLLPSILNFFEKHDESHCYSFLISYLQKYQEKTGVPPKYNSGVIGGALGSLFSFCQFMTSPIIGGLSDVYGRKRMLIVCSVGTTISYYLWSISGVFPLFVLSRFIGGLSKANISLCMAIVTDVSTRQNRAKGMALIGIAFSLAFVFGPSIGAVFAMYSDKTNHLWFTLPARCAATLSLASLLIIIFCFKETLPVEVRAQKLISSIGCALNYVNIIAIFKFNMVRNISPERLWFLRRMGLIYFFYLFIYSGLEFTVTFLMYHYFGYTAIDQAKMFLTTGVIMALLQGIAVRRLPCCAIRKAAICGLYLIVPAFICIGLANNNIALYIGMIIYAICIILIRNL